MVERDNCSLFLFEMIFLLFIPLSPLGRVLMNNISFLRSELILFDDGLGNDFWRHESEFFWFYRRFTSAFYGGTRAGRGGAVNAKEAHA